MDVHVLSAQYVSAYMFGGLQNSYVTYVHLITGGTVTNIGHVFASDFKIVAPTCREDLHNLPPSCDIIYDEIFVISQYWGEAYFHKMMEDLPRLAPFLIFLRKHSNILIHMSTRNLHTDYLFQALGLDPSRIITGNVHGKLVYLPRSTTCGHILISEGQLLSHEYRDYIKNNVTGNKTLNSVVLIKRSHSRRFNQQTQIENVVKNLTDKFGFRYELFPDNPSPSIEDTMLMFYRARVIIGPHGAGLSNMLFSRPGTIVIEAVCNPPNICYLKSSYHLGHRYYGVPSLKGCDRGIEIDIQELAVILQQFLETMKEERNS